MRELASLFLEMEMKNEAHELLATVLDTVASPWGAPRKHPGEYALAGGEIRVFDDIEEAERLLREVLQVQREDTAPTDPRRLEIITNLGCICFPRSQFAEQALFQEAIDVSEANRDLRRGVGSLEALKSTETPSWLHKASDEKKERGIKLADGAKKREAEEAAVAAAWEAIRATVPNLRQSPAQLWRIGRLF